MKIAFFTDTYHPSVDGVVRSMDLFEAGLRSRGHEVRIFAPEGKTGFEKKSSARYAPSAPFPPYPQYRIPLSTRKLIDEAVRFKPDIVHSHAMLLMGLAARKAALRARAPLVGTFHTLLPSAMHYLAPVEGLQLWGASMSWHYLKWFYSCFDSVISPSHFMQETLSMHGIFSTVAQSPVDVQKFSPGPISPQVKKLFGSGTSETKSESAIRAGGRSFGPRSGGRPHSSPSHPPAFLYLGRVAMEKNLDFLLDMARTRSFGELGAPLFIGGDGPYRKELGEKIISQGLDGKVRMLGRPDDARLVQYYRAASAVILPSKFETQGLVALEAMACGTPVAAMRGTALEELVHPKINGALFFDNPTEAAERLRQILQGRKKLAPGCLRAARSMDVPACTSRLLKVYAQAKRSHQKKTKRK